jgi:hypothetical protein
MDPEGKSVGYFGQFADYVRVRSGERVGWLVESRASDHSISWGHPIPRANLVGGHTSGTFYIRARLCAGACVLAVGETLGHIDPVRWPCSWPCGLSPWWSGFGWVWAADL